MFPSPSHPAVKPGDIVVCVTARAQLKKQPLADAVFPGLITFKKKERESEDKAYWLTGFPLINSWACAKDNYGNL